MSVPDIVETALGDEAVAATVELSGDDVMFVSPTRTLIYRSEGILSDETIEEYPHGAERLTLSESRRKARISLDFGLDGTKSITVPSGKLDAVLHPLLAGVLNAAGVTNPGETVLETFRFSELTIVITSDRVVKHIGEAVWDVEFEEFPFAGVTNLDFEEGSVAMTIVLTLNGRQERFKAPNQQARAIRERLESALFDYYEVDSLPALRQLIGLEEADPPADQPSSGIAFDAVEPLVADPPILETHQPVAVEEPDDSVPAESQTAEQNDGTDTFTDAGFEPVATDADQEIIDQLEHLSSVIDRQSELLEAQHTTLKQLLSELTKQQ